VYVFFGLLAAADCRPRSKHATGKTFMVLFSNLFTEIEFDCFGCCTGQNSRTANAPSPFCVFAAHKMTAAGALPFQFSTGGDFYPFCQALMAFLFRHLTDSLHDKAYRLKQSKNMKLALYAICGSASIADRVNSTKSAKKAYELALLSFQKPAAIARLVVN
jgi:hypothetical protein